MAYKFQLGTFRASGSVIAEHGLTGSEGLSANDKDITNVKTIHLDAIKSDGTDIDVQCTNARTDAFALTVGGTVKFKLDSSNDAISFNADIAAAQPGALDIGASGAQFKDIYIDGKAYIDQLGEALDCDNQNMTNVDIDSGAIDGTVIGAASVAAGSFAAIKGTTLSGSGAATFGAAMVVERSVTAGTSFIIGSADLNEADLEKLDGITDGTGAANKALVLGGSADITAGIRDFNIARRSIIGESSDNDGRLDVTGSKGRVRTFAGAAGVSLYFRDANNSDNLQFASAGTISGSGAVTLGSTLVVESSITAGTSFIIGSADLNETDLEKLDGITNGTAAANKALVVDGSGDVSGLNALGIASMASNWTNAGRTVADAGILTTVDINGGTVDGATIGASSHTTGKFTTVDATTDFTIDGLVITADTITNDAALTVVSTGLTLNASLDIALSADGGNVTMDDGTTTVFDFNTDDPELKIMDDAQVANYCSIAVGANGATTFTTVDADAAVAHLIITADGTVDIDSAGALTLDSGAGILLEPAAGSVITLDGTITIDAGVVANATSVTSTNFDGIIGAGTARAGTFSSLSCDAAAFAIANLAASSLTIGGSAVSLGGTITALTALTDLDCTAGSKTFFDTIGSGNSLTLGVAGSTLIVAGNLQVHGSSSVVHTDNYVIKDPVIGMGYGTGSHTGSVADRGILMGMSGENALAFLWNEGQDRFEFGRTTGVPTDTDFTMASFESIKAKSFIGNIATSITSGSSGTTLSNGFNYFENIGSSISVNLPASPTAGDSVKVKCGGDVGSSKTITVSVQGSHAVDGTVNPIILESPYAAIEFVYVASNDWRLF